MKNQTKFRLPTMDYHVISQFGSNQIIVDKTGNSDVNVPMLFIDTKSSNSTTKSMILVEQSNNLSSIQTANVTVIFNHRVSKDLY